MNCIKCNNELTGKQIKYCCQKCKNTHNNKRTQAYPSQQVKGLKRKKELIAMKGGKCSMCGYSKNYAGLMFHHLIPTKKSFTLDARRLSNHSWKRILEEAKDCQLICHNCHMEIEYPHLNWSSRADSNSQLHPYKERTLPN